MDTVIQGAIDMMTNSGVFHRKEMTTVGMRIVKNVKRKGFLLVDQQTKITNLHG